MTDPLGEAFDLPCGARVRNRFLKSAMSETLAGPDTAPNARHERLYAAFAAGGTGLVVTGNVMVDPRALGEPGNVVLQAGTDLAPFRAWAAAGSASGTALWMQLNHPGKQSPLHLSSEPVAPSAIPLGSGLERVFRPPRALTGDEIHALVERFATSASLAKEAGFSGVQIHGAHGYLVSQFLSPRHNTRDDQWGGSAENRRRFAIDIVRAMRRAVGDAFPVGIKLNSADFQKGGFDEEESLAVVRALADAGIDLVEISGGTYEAPAMTGARGVKKSTAEREGYFLAFAERVRQAVPVPIAVTGGFRSARAMRAAVTSGATDLVGLARPLALDPGLPNRILGGEDVVSAAGDPTTGFRVVDQLGMLSVTWYEQQLRLIADGGAPNPQLGAWLAIAKTVAHHGWGGLRQRRA